MFNVSRLEILSPGWRLMTMCLKESALAQGRISLSTPSSAAPSPPHRIVFHSADAISFSTMHVHAAIRIHTTVCAMFHT